MARVLRVGGERGERLRRFGTLRMPPAKRLSEAGFALVQSFEGFVAAPVRLADGRWLLGFGHVRSGPPEGPLDLSAAAEQLRRDLAPIEAEVATRVLASLTQAQFDALVSFASSIGPAAFASSDALKRLNAGDLLGCAEAMRAWCYGAPLGEAPQLLAALARRRAVEAAMLLDYGERAGAPSALVRPRKGPEMTSMVPGEAAPAAGPGLVDELTERLRRILAEHPATARVLGPPPAPPQDMEDDEPGEPQRAPAPGPTAAALWRALRDDQLAQASAALGGVLLIAIGLGVRRNAPPAWAELAAILLGFPGLMLLAFGAYLLIQPLVRPR